MRKFTMRQFVPLTDEMLYQMNGLPGPLVPYRAGLPCWHALDDAQAAVAQPKVEATAVAVMEVAEEAKAVRAAQPTAPGSYTSTASACQ